jgi:hypothetical protein
MPTPTYTALATVTLGTTTSSVTFSSIPATYRDLILIASCKHATTGGSGSVLGRFNGDTGSYPFVYMATKANNTIESGAVDVNALVLGRFSNVDFTVNTAQMLDVSATDKHKTVLSNGALGLDGSAAFSQLISANRWPNTAAVTSLNLFPETAGGFASGSTFNLYGVIA